MMEQVLAFDQALGTTGWFYYDGAEYYYGIISGLGKEYALDERVAYMVRAMQHLVDRLEPDTILLESVQLQSNVMSHKQLSCLLGGAMYMSHQNYIRPFIFAPSEWRKVIRTYARVKGIEISKSCKRQEWKELALALANDTLPDGLVIDDARGITRKSQLYDVADAHGILAYYLSCKEELVSAIGED